MTNEAESEAVASQKGVGGMGSDGSMVGRRVVGQTGDAQEDAIRSLDEATRAALAGQLLAMADDELMLGHRDSEWCGHAPILEEDIAFANIAQDEIGHAMLWYNIHERLTGQTPDHVVFFRPAADFRNAQLVELANGDFAFSMMRQYLFDCAESFRLDDLAASTFAPIAEVAAKVRNEEVYHLRHTANMVLRLGLGTPESHDRMQRALDELWPYALQLFVPLPDEPRLAAAGIVPNAAALREAWLAAVVPSLAASNLVVPATREPAATSRLEHTASLDQLVGELQETARLEGPEVRW